MYSNWRTKKIEACTNLSKERRESHLNSGIAFPGILHRMKIKIFKNTIEVKKKLLPDSEGVNYLKY
jgi:hypothetical protein